MNTFARTIQVHLLHSCPIMRAGLNAILSTQPDFRISELRPAAGVQCIIIADYDGGMRAARDAWPRHRGQSTRVLVLTMHDKEWEVRLAIDNGVHGYLLQGCDAGELIDSIRALSRGDNYMSAALTCSVAASLQRAMLTPRETDVLRVLARGSSDKLIARELGITTGTVKSHMKQVLAKLGANARTQAVVVAMSRGLLSAQHAAGG